jgi:simple sugar transport system permease protein
MSDASASVARRGAAHMGRRVTQSAARRLTEYPWALPLVLLVLVVAVFQIANRDFASALNVSGMFAFIPELGLIALGMTLLLTARQFDLSVGAVFGFVPLLVFILANEHSVPLPAAVAVGLAVGAVIGLVNGLLVTKAGISSFLVTLSTMLIVRGAALYISEGFPQSTLESESSLNRFLVGTMTIGDLTLNAGVIWFVIIALVLAYVLNQTRYGNWIMATGGNREAARARGIKTDRVTIALFVLAAVLASLAGVISDIRVGSAYPTAGTGYELEAIAIAVVGGTSLFGGAGTILGTVIGAILLRAIRNGVVLVGVPGLAYDMFVGLVILVAMLLQSALRRLQVGAGKGPP